MLVPSATKMSIKRGFHPGNDLIKRFVPKIPNFAPFSADANLSDINQPALSGDRDRFSSANRIQLFQDNLDVCFHRVLTDVKDLTNFFIALAEGHLRENLKFAPGELRLRHGVRQLRGDILR